jgi:branched-chain amino acid aminotransferase
MKNMTHHFVYHNKEFSPLNGKHLSILDIGLLRNFGVFEKLRAYNRVPFMLDAHLNRLLESCDALGLELKESKEALKSIVEQMIQKTTAEHFKIALVVTGNIPSKEPIGKEPNLFVYTNQLDPIPEDWLNIGIKLKTLQYERFLPKCKTFQYLPRTWTLKQNEGFQEVLYLNTNQEILEAGCANFFGFQKDKLVTTDKNILLGITRGIILELAKTEFSIDLRPLHVDELNSLDEAFITSTYKEVLPVKQIDHVSIGDGKLGPRTHRLMQLFYQYTQQKK